MRVGKRLFFYIFTKTTTMKSFYSLLLVVFGMCLRAQNADTLVIDYYENYPYAYTEDGKLKGIEIDILNEYTTWLKTKKNMDVIVVYKPFTDFSAFYSAVKSGKANVIGAGSVTRTDEREKELSFSAPYLHNVAVLITSGRMQTLREKTDAEVKKIFADAKAFAVKGSNHVNYLTAIKNKFLPQMSISTVDNQKQVLNNVVSSPNTIGYVDIIAYWSFLKTNPGKFIKMQKAFTESKEDLGYIMPLNSKYTALLSEFFEAGFGFTSTKTYHQILERYLGYEILESVEVK